MKATILFTLFIGLCLTQSARAQYPQIQAGRYGVFVQVDKLLHGPRFGLERLETGTRAWKRIYTNADAPRSARDLKIRLVAIAPKNPLYELPSDTLASALFRQFMTAPTTDSLAAYGQHPQILEALGVGYLDTAVVAGHRYDYRIRLADAPADAPIRTTRTITMPEANARVAHLETITRSLRYEADGRTVRITWLLKKTTPKLAGLRVFRATYAQTGFTEIGTERGFITGKRDSTFAFIADHDARRKMIYQYVVVPVDLLGNEGHPSDTLTVTNLRKGEVLPVIASVNATSAGKAGAIRLAWKLSSTNDLRSVEIWRSNRYDDGYTRIASAQPTDTVYFDSQVEPVESYYYQLRPNGTYDQLATSIKVSGMVKAYRPALLPPSFLRVSQVKDTLRFTWQRADFDTRGYYLYNSTGPNTPMQQYSTLIESRDSVIRYAVPVRNLPLGTGYRWAVAALNTSYNIGPKSNEVYSDMRLPDRVATPLNPVVLRQAKGVLVVWDNMKEIDPYITGYTVYRKEETGKETKIHQQTPGDRGRNAYADSTVRAGKHYTYRVKAFRPDNRESAFSSTADYFRPLPPVLPLRGINVLTTNQGVRLAWDEPLDQTLDKIVVYRYTDKTERPRLIGSLPGRQTQYLDREATPGIAYYYTLVAIQPDKRESEPTDPIGVEWR
ncbi:fibronectin type III domain-containing protein [Spirosoma areae]